MLKDFRLFTLVFFSIFTLLFVSCGKEDEISPILEEGSYEKGVFVTNEGPFLDGVGTITYYDSDSKTTENNVMSSNMCESFTLHRMLKLFET